VEAIRVQTVASVLTPRDLNWSSIADKWELADHRGLFHFTPARTSKEFVSN
jgi:hypothetical protein